MNRFFIKDTKEEVFLGKPLKITLSKGGVTQHIEANPCTPELMAYLINLGVVITSSDKPKYPNPHGISLSVKFYVAKLAKKMNLKFEVCEAMLGNIASYSPITALSLLAKQISLELDQHYEGHIRNAEHVFVLSTVNGTITEIPSEARADTNYRNFAAFRSLEDANLAYSILSHLYNEAFIK